MKMLAMWETPEWVQNKIDLNGPIKHRRADKHSSWDQNQHTHVIFWYEKKNHWMDQRHPAAAKQKKMKKNYIENVAIDNNVVV